MKTGNSAMHYFKVLITRPGGWMPSGVMHSTYTTEEYGEYERISPRHYYCRRNGRDIYPTPEQVERLLAGEEVVMGMAGWA